MLIELPQAVRRMMPSLVAQLVVLLKDTSLGYIVAYGEFCGQSSSWRTSWDRPSCSPVFFVAAAMYIAINIAISRLAVWIERRGSKKAAGGTAEADPVGCRSAAAPLTSEEKWPGSEQIRAIVFGRALTDQPGPAAP